MLSHESPDKQIAQWDVETIDSEKYAQANIDELAKDMGGKGGYVIYVGSLTVRGLRANGTKTYAKKVIHCLN